MLSLEQVLMDDNRREVGMGGGMGVGQSFFWMVFPGHGLCVDNHSSLLDPLSQSQRPTRG